MVKSYLISGLSWIFAIILHHNPARAFHQDPGNSGNGIRHRLFEPVWRSSSNWIGHFDVYNYHLQTQQKQQMPKLFLSSSSSDSESPDPLQELEVIDIQEGTGKDVAKFDTIVTIKYTGRFLNSGEQFDESMISFKLGYGRVLDGCDQGIKGMKVGGSRVLKIPSKLGFGPTGFTGPDYTIPPNTDLEYTVELMSVASGPMAEAAANMGIGLDPNTVYLK